MSYLCKYGKSKPSGRHFNHQKESTIKRDSELNSDKITLLPYDCPSESSQSLKLSLTMYTSSSDDNLCIRPC